MKKKSTNQISNQNPVFLVCNAHLDPIWLWVWEEGAAEAISTFRTAADFCEEYDGFIFNHNEAVLYEWVEEYEPQLFKRIQKLVKAGKWHIMGGWFLQPDCNMPSGEGFIRQIGYGRRYFKEKFGKTPTTAINFDPFGHNRGLVQIMKKSGYDSYLFWRPSKEFLKLPADIFRWQGFDDSEVIGIRSMEAYLTLRGTAQAKLENHLKIRAEDSCSVMLWGVGNHGGGPSRIDIKALNKMIKEKDVPIKHSTPEELVKYIKKSKAKLPVHADDLNPWAVGCYTSQVLIKQNYRKLEQDLLRTEKICAAACAAGLMKWPESEIAQAERDMIFTQFHDIMPGSSIQPAEESAIRMMGHGIDNLDRARARAFFALSAGQPKIKDGTIPVMVFNPHPYEVDTLVECEFQLPDQNHEPGWTVPVAMSGKKELPTNLEQEASNINLDWRKKVVFQAKLAPMAMNRFDCRLDYHKEKPEVDIKAKNGCFNFKTDTMQASISAKTGLIEKYSVDGKDLLNKNASKLLVMNDNVDPWGMTVNSYRSKAGAFRLATAKEAAEICACPKPVKPVQVIEDGAARSVVEAIFMYNRSYAVVRYEIPKVGSKIGVYVRVCWVEADKCIKLSFPTQMKDGDYFGEAACGTQKLRSDGTEQVAQRWISVCDEKADKAFSLINNGIYGSDMKNGEVRMTLLRSAVYSAHPIEGKDTIDSNRYHNRIDNGTREFRFYLSGGKCTGELDEITRQADLVAQPPMALSFCPSGEGKKPSSLIKISGDTVSLLSVTKSHKGKNWIVRLFNPTDKPTASRILVPSLKIGQRVAFGKYSIVTLKIDPSKKKITECKLQGE